ncbi:MAG: hypothetical protein ABW115_04860 [Candidatus Thiodiazotropha sp. 6PLUC6]
MRLEKDTSLLDRLALGFLNAILGFLTGLILWLGINSLFSQGDYWLPFESVIWFTLIMALLGMFVHDALLSTFYARVWHFLFTLFKN